MVSSSVECVSLVVVQVSALFSNYLHRLPNCLFSVIMCPAVSEEAAAPSILVGAQPRLRCWTRDLRATNWSTQPQRDGSSEWKTPRVWDCSSHFAQIGEAEGTQHRHEVA